MIFKNSALIKMLISEEGGLWVWYNTYKLKYHMRPQASKSPVRRQNKGRKRAATVGIRSKCSTRDWKRFLTFLICNFFPQQWTEGGRNNLRRLAFRVHGSRRSVHDASFRIMPITFISLWNDSIELYTSSKNIWLPRHHDWDDWNPQTF